MKCTSKNRRMYRRKRQRTYKSLVLSLIIVALIATGIVFYLKQNTVSITDYEKENYSIPFYKEALLIDNICVTSGNEESDYITIHDELHAAGLFRLDTAEVEYAENVHEKLYPASTTKLLTAYIALKYGNLEDTITVSKEAVGVPLDSSRAGLITGDKITLKDLLYGLMLPSGNDSAVAIAEYISGSEKEFAVLMNEEARKLGATNSNFVNAHGYHDDNHYTTAYDLYLILKECVKNDTFLEIVSSKEYTLKIDQKNGTYRNVTWRQTNQFVTGLRSEPNGIDVIGGKTGTTDQAGSCLIMYLETDAHPYISVVMGANNKAKLYENMTYLISGAVKSEN